MSRMPDLPPPVLPPIGDVKITRLCELRPYGKNVNCRFIVLSIVESAKSISEGGFIYSFRVADDSGSIIANFWNAIGDCIRVGDIILVTGGFVTMFKSSMRLACKVGTVVRLGTFAESYSDAVDHSASRWLPNPEKANEMIRQEDALPGRRGGV